MACSESRTPTAPASVTVTSVTVTGSTPAVGSRSQFTAIANLSNGTTQTVTNQATWQSSNPAVAAVNSAGEVTGIAAGDTDIAATYQTVEGRTRITIAAVREGCSYAVSPASQSVAVEGGSFTATVTTSGVDCGWTASANASWITITSGSSGSTTGTIAYTVAAHDDANPRSGAITIQWNGGGSQVAVAQAPITLCKYTLSPASQDVTMFGGAFTFTATRNTPNGCSWAAATSTPWITLTGATSGASPGTISYGVTTSNWPIVRTGKITVQWSGGSVDFVVTQAAVVGSCTSPLAFSIPASRGANLINIGQGCFYLLGAREIDVPWITVRGTSGGALYLDVLYDENTGPERTGHITYRGYDGALVLSITVTQAAGSRP